MGICHDRLKQLREASDYTLKDIARILGVSEATVQRYESGKIVHVPYPTVVAYAKLFNVTPQYIMGWANDTEEVSDRMKKVADSIEEQKTPSNKETEPAGVKIPILGHVAAGIPINAIEDIIDYEEIEPELARTGEYFGLQIQGDSMETRIKDHDYVIVRKQEYANDGDLVIALIEGVSAEKEAVCKRLKKYANGIALLSNNPAYEPMFFSTQQVEQEEVKIIGKVKELRAKF